jgi:hypothetical protein
LDESEGRLSGRAIDEEIRTLIAEARAHLERLKSVKGLITLGSPKIFDKNSHLLFPSLLMLNLVLPLLKEEKVPVDNMKELVKKFPSFAQVARPLINPANFEDSWPSS